MGKKAFKLARADVAEPCPKCKNTQTFTAHSSQFAEDCCEIWIVCRCGFDPTADKTGHRMEDVWGSLDPESISVAVECSWNDVVRSV